MWETVSKAAGLFHYVSLSYAALVIALYAGGIMMISARWRSMLVGLGCPVALRDTVLSNLAFNFVNNVTPGRVGGEVFRVVLLRTRVPIDLKRAAASSAYDRLADVLVLPFYVLLTVPVLPSAAARLRILAAGLSRFLPWLLGLLVLFAALYLVSRRISRLRAWAAGVQELIVSMRVRRRYFLGGLFFAAMTWVVDSCRLFVVATAFGVTLSPWQAAALSVVMSLSYLAPTMGGLGAVESAAVATLCLFGTPPETAVAITLLDRGVTYGLGTCVGALTLGAIGGWKLWARPAPEA